MQRLITKYLNKLHQQCLADKKKAIFIALDSEFFSNKPLKGDTHELSKIFQLMNINTILFSPPAEPYWSIINELTDCNSQFNKYLGKGFCDDKQGIKRIIPNDCESRTFLHDIPVINDFSLDDIAKTLSIRKSSIIRNHGIITYGTLTPEQAYVSYASTCFAIFVKYFINVIEYLEYCFTENIPPDRKFSDRFLYILKYLCQNGYLREDIEDIGNVDDLDIAVAQIMEGLKHINGVANYPLVSKISKTPRNEEDVMEMLIETGKAVVKYRLIDSYFGNISYVFEDKIYISQTGSSLDELEGCIDVVPLDGSSTVGITSSSELPTHKKIYLQTSHRAILHAHPIFSVIISMYCPFRDCPHYVSKDTCYKDCKESRYIAKTPVVSGEIGTGKTGIVNTVPFKMKESRGVIVYGHGVFTSGKDAFLTPLSLMLNIEKVCQQEYFKKIKDYLGPFSY